MFTPADVDANVVYLNDRTNPDLWACRSLPAAT